MRLHMTGNGLHPMRAAALRPALRPACSAVSRAGKILPPRRMAADFSELDDDALLELWWAAAEQGDTQRLKDIAGAEPNIINLVRMHSGAATAHAHAHAHARARAHARTHAHAHAHARTHATPQVQTDETYLLSELSSKGKDAKKADFENLGVSALHIGCMFGQAATVCCYRVAIPREM